MKNVSSMQKWALSLRLRMLPKHAEIGKALAPFHPVGWSAAYRSADARTSYASEGMARLEDNTPIQRDTIFRIASISKLFVAAAALRLVANGSMSLDDPAEDILGFSTGKAITLRQLLTHTAALDDHAVYNRVAGTADAPALDAVLRGSFLGYAPGTRFHYSNLGAGVAGMMVEAASGLAFDDYIRQTFFAPFGIDASFHPQRIQAAERMANCYRVPGRSIAYDARAIARLPLDEGPDPRMHYGVPAGKLMISAPDLLDALVRMARDDKAMFVRQNHVGSVSCDACRGLGPAFAPMGVLALGQAYWGHQGAAYGALCEAWIDPETREAAVLLTNGARLTSFAPLYSAGQNGIAALLDRPGSSGVY